MRAESVIDLRDIEVRWRPPIAEVRPTHLNIDIDVCEELRHSHEVEIRVV